MHTNTVVPFKAAMPRRRVLPCATEQSGWQLQTRPQIFLNHSCLSDKQNTPSASVPNSNGAITLVRTQRQCQQARGHSAYYKPPTPPAEHAAALASRHAACRMLT